ncbi:GNAT family N-acetyltransferase [Bacillus glycinifermentans]|uniref:GNAT family N-acetyltransferase n=1 Tax=Bacillus glycinifermentans TaxID=1664069 RepID=UPI001FF60546|nr:GNAT family N-acetyltransferase [Bacillus glycinifermentans]UOY87119.1 hypothetical protein MW696_13485 [Bacillus glycinifermentans]
MSGSAGFATSLFGRSLGKRLVEALVSHPKLAGVCLMLGTDDAHGLYEKYGLANVD